MVELLFDNAILGSYGLTTQDVRSTPLLKLSFARKLHLFKETCSFSRADYNTLDEFRKKRNEIVHKIGGGMFIIDESEKNEIMINAVRSALIAQSLFESIMKEQGRVVKTRRPKGKKWKI
jgi:hypothetical protein